MLTQGTAKEQMDRIHLRLDEIESRLYEGYHLSKCEEQERLNLELTLGELSQWWEENIGVTYD